MASKNAPPVIIPAELYSKLLPGKELSIFELLHFTKPVVGTTPCSLDVALFYTRDEPTDSSLDVLMSTPAPNAQVIKALVHVLPAMARAGYKSV